MKTFLLSVCLFLFSVFCKAQVEFAPVGAKWTYLRGDCAGIFCQQIVYSIETIEFKGDYEVINGINCKKLKGGFDNFYVYQDSSKVYYYNPELEGFHLLYDFWLQAGESFFTPRLLGGEIEVTVAQRDTQIVNGVPLEVFTGKIICWEGMEELDMKYNGLSGMMNRFVIYPLDNCIIDPLQFREFRCYEDPVIGLYNPGNIACDSLPVATHDVVKEPEFFVFANPVYHTLGVRFAHPVSAANASLSLFNPAGTLVKTAAIKSGINELDLDLSAFPPGLYLLAYEENGLVVQREKVVVQR